MPKTVFLSPLAPVPNRSVDLGNWPAPASLVNLSPVDSQIYSNLYNFMTTVDTINRAHAGYQTSYPVNKTRWQLIIPALNQAIGSSWGFWRSAADVVTRKKTQMIGLLIQDSSAVVPVAAPLNQIQAVAPQVAPGAAMSRATAADSVEEDEDEANADDEVAMPYSVTTSIWLREWKEEGKRAVAEGRPINSALVEKVNQVLRAEGYEDGLEDGELKEFVVDRVEALEELKELDSRGGGRRENGGG